MTNEDLLERLGLDKFNVTLLDLIILSLSSAILFLGLRELFENRPDGFFGEIFEDLLAEDIERLRDGAWKSVHLNERVEIYMGLHEFFLLSFRLYVLEFVLKTRLHGDTNKGGQKSLKIFNSLLACIFLFLKHEGIISLLIGNKSQDILIQKVFQAVGSFSSLGRSILFHGFLLILLHDLSLCQNI